MPILSRLSILAAFDLPLKEAIEFLKRKLGNGVFTWAWDDLAAEAHQKAFTVAKALQADVLHSLMVALAEAQAEGLPFESFKRDLEPTLKAKGWWGKQLVINPKTGLPEKVQLGSAWRLETIYRTNLQSSFQSGRYKQQKAVAARRPYWQYHAITDIRTTGVCRELHLKVFRADDPIWQRAYPPNHYNCRARVVSLSEREMGRLGLTTAAGGDVPNWKPEKGFDASPETAWRPDVSKYPAAIGKQLALDLERGAK